MSNSWYRALDHLPEDDTPVLGAIPHGCEEGRFVFRLEIVCYSQKTQAWRLMDVPESERYVPVMLWTPLDDWTRELDNRILYGTADDK